MNNFINYDDAIIGINEILKFDLNDIINKDENTIIEYLIKLRKFGRCFIIYNSKSTYEVLEKNNHLEISCNTEEDIIKITKYKMHVGDIYKNIYNMIKLKKGKKSAYKIIKNVENDNNIFTLYEIPIV
ncbi:hypothetical protein CHBEV_254 [Choristoneura biennis entomopoxvirus]|uniref:Uncharacterized protein n=1 Tax=Choristoneura biennis entomopoxvirus TaxID=10288 RepID=A0A916KPX6_CBEPV|nr:hypothetical protein CHBEV_254 [Choristoneura biennis entomopoxvirus]CCU55822.1 hypothetical protein CHBEV_254 [Choristoneura biennis entomopoxvirus]